MIEFVTTLWEEIQRTTYEVGIEIYDLEVN